MAIATLPDIPPDFGAEPTPVANVDEVQFGDGYKQRALAGVNARRTDFSELPGRQRASGFAVLLPTTVSELPGRQRAVAHIFHCK